MICGILLTSTSFRTVIPRWHIISVKSLLFGFVASCVVLVVFRGGSFSQRYCSDDEVQCTEV
jgi:hypothetical protein